jgi:ligand-binding sensor domain-containing protein
MCVIALACNGCGAADDEEIAFSSVPDLPSGRLLTDVWVFDAQNVWITGDEGVFFFDGQTAITDLPGDPQVASARLRADGPDNLWAAGYNVTHHG